MQEQIRILFVSRRNSLRSPMAEACLRQLSPHRFIARSCGQPGRTTRELHPAASAALKSAGIAPLDAAPAGWDMWMRAGSPRIQLVITLDEGVESIAPHWPGQPDTALWGFPDLAAAADSPDLAHSALLMLYSMRRRLELLASLPLHGLDRAAVRSDLRDLAHMG